MATSNLHAHPFFLPTVPIEWFTDLLMRASQRTYEHIRDVHSK